MEDRKEKGTQSDGIEMILRDPKLKMVTVFCSPLKNVTQRIRITRPKSDRLIYKTHSLVVSYGAPNYSEREWLKTCKKAKCLPRRFWFGKTNGRGYNTNPNGETTRIA